jgi:alcohol dehydrogenase (cytochrome c)
MKRFARVIALLICAAPVFAQSGVDPAQLSKPATDSWPTYNGDYSGRRFSTLKQITDANVQSLSLAWIYRLGPGGPPGGSIKATPLQVDGVMYFALPDHVWAVDARTGRERWHFGWQSKGGDHIGNRGVGISGDLLYFETPDCNLVALDIKDGTERWHKPICDLDLYYFGTSAPVAIKNHIIAGVSGDDLDIPGYIEAHDPVTGERQWRWYVVPQKKGDPGSDSWPNEEAAKHGGGMTWQPVTYDPELNLVYVATGNPQPVVAHVNRAGDNLFTASIVALDVDTGKMAWYFQASPHDTHDWDATQTPVLIDDVVNGQPRKLVAQASRNGKFFVLDRTTGKPIVTSEFVKINWSKGVGPDGRPIPNPEKNPQIDGALVTPNQGGAANWPPPSFSPLTGLFYVPATQGWSIWYIYDPGENPQGWGGTDRGGYSESMLTAIDYKTGKPRWTHKWEGVARSGVISTAGNVVFTGGNTNSLVALNATTGDALWQARLNTAISNGPITYTLDGQQYVVVGAGDTLWAFVLNPPPARK